MLKVERHFDSLLTLIYEVGGIYKGLSLIGSLLLFHWQKYNHDSKLASSLLLEKKVNDAPSSELTRQEEEAKVTPIAPTVR